MRHIPGPGGLGRFPIDGAGVAAMLQIASSARRTCQDQSASPIHLEPDSAVLPGDLDGSRRESVSMFDRLAVT